MGGVFNTMNANLYHYAGNNPVKYTDPDGKFDANIFYQFATDTAYKAQTVGVVSGGNVMRETFIYQRKEYRIDLENLRGINLVE